MQLAYPLALVALMCAGLGVLMLAPMGICLIYGEAAWVAFFRSALLSIFLGSICYWIFRPRKVTELNHREGVVIVALSWLAAGLLGGLPLYLSGDFVTYTDGFFEAVSGFTTTGASVLTDVEAAGKGVLFWRALTHWLGGMGFVVLSLAILPLLGVGGMELYKAEVPSPTPDRLAPRIADTASVLWKVYAILTALETLALMLCGMDLFDAVCHAFATMATGGFSTMNASVGGYANPAVHYVITLFMVLAGINFTLHFHLFRGRPRAFWRDEEWRFYVAVYLAFSLGIALSLFFSADRGAEESLRAALFQAATILTTTGFATEDYSLWPAAALALLMALMFVGGSAGSTGGGPKCMRVWVILKQTYSELIHLVHPRVVAPVKLNHRVVEPRVIFSIWGFMGLYLALFLVVGIVLSFMGLDTTTSLSASIACLGNIGPGLGGVGPAANYAHLPIAAKWLLSAAMIVGRLEIYTVLVLMMPEFWRR